MKIEIRVIFYKMIDEQEKPETKICEVCGAKFSCGANIGKCWCFEIELKTETLTELREDYKNCLCENCLGKVKNEIQFI